MANKVSPSFFEADSILFVGYSKRHAAYCKSVREAFEKRGAAVYPVNTGNGPYDVKVYATVDEVPGLHALAVVITNKSRNAELLEALAAKGVKRVMFGSTASADVSTLERCATLGMEGAVVCPLQALGTGFHRFHGWLSGVPKVTAGLSGTARAKA